MSRRKRGTTSGPERSRWLALPVLLVASPSAQEPFEEHREALAPVVEGLAERELALGVHGLVVAVETRGTTLYAGGLGFLDELHATRADAETPFPVGALLPTFLAVAALRRAEAGELELEAPLGRYLPGTGYGETVRVDMLLTQTTGIPGYGDLLEAKGALDRPLDPGLVLAWLADGPLASTPGTCVAYSATNDLVLGLVLERLAGEPLSLLLEKNVFEPAGMQATGWAERGAAPPPDPSVQELDVRSSQPLGTPAPFAAEGLCSTALDLLRFQRALDRGGLLSDRMQALRVAAPTLPGHGPSAVARGVVLSTLEDVPCEAAGGTMGGGEVYLAGYPSMETSLVVLVRGGSGRARVLGTSIARALFAFEGPTVADLPLGGALPERYAGEYYAACTSYGVSVEDGHLQLHLPSGEDHRLLFQGGETFVSVSDPDLRAHFQLEGERAVTLLLTEHGITLAARRVR